ncbi:MAG: fatty acid desaturase [Sandaracinaceae bacterium]
MSNAVTPLDESSPDVGTAPASRSGRELIAATKPFQSENRARSWFHVFETFGVIAALTAAIALVPYWYVRLPLAIFQGLVVVRAFILYHDFMHNSLLRGSKLAKLIFYPYGVLVLTPPNVWRQTHNYHHAHTAKIVGSHVGSYLMVTTEMWQQMKPSERFMYRLIRHPVTIAIGYFTIFLYGMCASSFLRNPRKNWDSAIAIVVALGLLVGLGWWLGFWTMFFVYWLPLMVATATGGYLFYAQHNFPEMHVQPRSEWEYTRAALESSSYMETGAIMGWLTGNIGYHHVHHLNPGIPFYRLPEAMAAIPELQSPRKTSLWPRDIIACFRQKLWDADAQQMVGYPK